MQDLAELNEPIGTAPADEADEAEKPSEPQPAEASHEPFYDFLPPSKRPSSKSD